MLYQPELWRPIHWRPANLLSSSTRERNETQNEMMWTAGIQMKWVCDHRSESQFKQLRKSPKKRISGLQRDSTTFFRAFSQLLKLRFTAMVTYSFHQYIVSFIFILGRFCRAKQTDYKTYMSAQYATMVRTSPVSDKAHPMYVMPLSATLCSAGIWYIERENFDHSLTSDYLKEMRFTNGMKKYGWLYCRNLRLDLLETDGIFLECKFQRPLLPKQGNNTNLLITNLHKNSKVCQMITGASDLLIDFLDRRASSTRPGPVQLRPAVAKMQRF